jgi:hypothetical protein
MFSREVRGEELDSLNLKQTKVEGKIFSIDLKRENN